MRLRAVTRVYNEAMIKARKEKGLTMANLAELVGTHVVRLYEIQRLNYRQRTPAGQKAAMELADRISFVLEIPRDDVIPEELLGLKLKSKYIRIQEVPISQMAKLADGDIKRLAAPPEDGLVRQDLINSALAQAQLNHKQSTALKMRFGLKGRGRHTYAEIGKELKLSLEGARQTVSKAMDKFKQAYEMIEACIERPGPDKPKPTKAQRLLLRRVTWGT